MSAKLCHALLARRLFSGISSTRNRFYEEARVVFKPVEEVYNIYLDKHCLVTPKRNPVEIYSEALALAVAQEWNMQTNELRVNLMRLTGLIFTATDNPMSLQKSDLLSQVLQFLDKDTILYRLEENSNLLHLEETNWNPVVEWVNWEYGLSVKPSYSIVEEAVIDNNSRVRLTNQLSDYTFLQLVGLQYATEALKSVFLTLATVSSRLDVDEAVELALLEQKYQSDVWGKVEWAHDIEREELISRLSAGVLLVHLGDFKLRWETKSQENEIVKNDTKVV
uniref:ATP synthase mitochondrial F1 complex assembly factor 2 n=1 Tax=Wuchereria bancrofti TaxID=6293 RepID=A0AAF5PZ68_WUCBA